MGHLGHSCNYDAFVVCSQTHVDMWFGPEKRAQKHNNAQNSTAFTSKAKAQLVYTKNQRSFLVKNLTDFCKWNSICK